MPFTKVKFTEALNLCFHQCIIQHFLSVRYWGFATYFVSFACLASLQTHICVYLKLKITTFRLKKKKILKLNLKESAKWHTEWEKYLHIKNVYTKDKENIQHKKPGSAVLSGLKQSSSFGLWRKLIWVQRGD